MLSSSFKKKKKLNLQITIINTLTRQTYGVFNLNTFKQCNRLHKLININLNNQKKLLKRIFCDLKFINKSNQNSKAPKSGAEPLKGKPTLTPLSIKSLSAFKWKKVTSGKLPSGFLAPIN